MPPAPKNPTPAYPSQWVNPEDIKAQGYKYYQAVRNLYMPKPDAEYSPQMVNAWVTAWINAGYRVEVQYLYQVKTGEQDVLGQGFSYQFFLNE